MLICIQQTNAAHMEFNFETAYVTGGSIVHADQGLSASHETVDAKDVSFGLCYLGLELCTDTSIQFWAECCHAPNNLEQDHFKAHIG